MNYTVQTASEQHSYGATWRRCELQDAGYERVTQTCTQAHQTYVIRATTGAAGRRKHRHAAQTNDYYDALPELLGKLV